MHNKPRALVAAAATVAVMAAAGCASGPLSPPSLSSSVAMPTICGKTGPVVFAVSGRQDSPAPALTGTMQAAAMKAVDIGAAIGLVDVDGHPHLIAASAFSDPDAGNSIALNQDRVNFLGQLASAVAAIRAANPHVDVLDALDTAGRAVRAACSHGGTVYLKDSGLSEIGVMDFRQPGLLEAMPSEIVASLTAEHELPDLKGVAVVLVGVGDTAPPQPPLSIAESNNLIAIWSAIAKRRRSHVGADRSCTAKWTRARGRPAGLAGTATCCKARTQFRRNHHHRAGSAALPVQQRNPRSRRQRHPPACYRTSPQRAFPGIDHRVRLSRRRYRLQHRSVRTPGNCRPRSSHCSRLARCTDNRRNRRRLRRKEPEFLLYKRPS